MYDKIHYKKKKNTFYKLKKKKKIENPKELCGLDLYCVGIYFLFTKISVIYTC